MTTRSGWSERGDGLHWDHLDGSFIERDSIGTGRQHYTLYSARCARLSDMGSLLSLMDKHAELMAKLRSKR